ncbi:AAA family ATPase [Brevibacillus laterosporus]|uniref:AAA family ATPase n=1 Tax=Brevibacillus laterosporus TaxID=1465 RepID=UPI00036D51B3|nr:AAA family ATPase [Brevibacillus laterosporus]ATO49347.1 AAA family ATPase [Brevibacillus laterosporus DSM 25]MBG9775884.1 ATPase AAA [Brevibacillus laterosporus]MBG9796722.1 ATPase AAA [Brevibacillus laterosporus]MBG9800773.1 ATPase AAA [Brevibacillus laterosporus]MCR8936648.1 AAA family ATPase [Brevibacillus laterosporus]
MYLKKLKVLEERLLTEEYPFNIPLFRHLKHIDFTRNVTFFVGENGTGKSTLLEAIAYKIGFSETGGSRNNILNEPESSRLGEHLRLSWFPKITNGFFLRAETFYNFATYIDELQIQNPEIDVYKSYGGKSLHKQSHGESFISLLMNRFGKKGIYLLDEPEAALSPSKQISLLKIISDLEREGSSQFIIATHSPILLGYPNATLFSFDGEAISEVEYENTDHYQITKYFLTNKDKFLKQILKK